MEATKTNSDKSLNLRVSNVQDDSITLTSIQKGYRIEKTFNCSYAIAVNQFNQYVRTNYLVS